MRARVISFVLRWRAVWRAWRAKRYLVSHGVFRRVSEAQMSMGTHAFTNVLRKELTARMDAGKPVKSAQEIADIGIGLLNRRWNLDTSGVQLLVEVDETQTEVTLIAAPSIGAVREAHGERHG